MYTIFNCIELRDSGFNLKNIRGWKCTHTHTTAARIVMYIIQLYKNGLFNREIFPYWFDGLLNFLCTALHHNLRVVDAYTRRLNRNAARFVWFTAFIFEITVRYDEFSSFSFALWNGDARIYHKHKGICRELRSYMAWCYLLQSFFFHFSWKWVAYFKVVVRQVFSKENCK